MVETKQNHSITSLENKNYIGGLIFFFLFFIILIPYILYKLKWYTFLRLYFVNTDLIATILSFDKGPFVNYFRYLYGETGPFIGYISSNLISWSVLIGIIFIILVDSRSKSVSFGMSQAAFILVITYLFPNRIILELMKKFDLYFKKHYNLSSDTVGYLSLLIGLILAILFISFEDLCLKYFSKSLEKWIYKLIEM
jgi:hypothetical protein